MEENFVKKNSTLNQALLYMGLPFFLFHDSIQF